MLGREGVHNDFLPVTKKDIEEYAYSILGNKCGEEEYDLIFKLLSQIEIFDLCTPCIDQCLQSLSEIENTEWSTERRKWRYVSLDMLIRKLSGDVMSDIIDIYEFWTHYERPIATLDIINESPLFDHVFYDKLLSSHREWLHQEKAEIIEAEKNTEEKGTGK